MNKELKDIGILSEDVSGTNGFASNVKHRKLQEKSESQFRPQGVSCTVESRKLTSTDAIKCKDDAYVETLSNPNQESQDSGMIYDGDPKKDIDALRKEDHCSIETACPSSRMGKGHLCSKQSSFNLVNNGTKQLKLLSAPPVLKAPKGHLIIDDFISPQEENDLVQYLDTDLRNPWKITTFSGYNRSKAYGTVIDVQRRKVQHAVFEIPKLCQFLRERMRAEIPSLKAFHPDEINTIEYRKEEGHWLRPHVDDRQLSGDILVNLSLCGACEMTYEREKGYWEAYKIILKQRSLQVLTGECRYSFTHSILNQDLLGPRRISITFRETIWP